MRYLQYTACDSGLPRGFSAIQRQYFRRIRPKRPNLLTTGQKITQEFASPRPRGHDIVSYELEVLRRRTVPG